MPWFSKKKKRKVKKGVVNISKDDAVVAATSKPLFAVVVQNFEASVSDQLSVERGQVVESLFVQQNWIYIRNVNGQCGYVPSDFCFPLDKLRMGLSDDKNDQVRQIRVHPRPTTIHVDTLERDEGGGEGAVGGGEEEEEDDEVVNSPDSGISCSQQASSSNMESVQSFHTIRERLTAGSRNLERSQNEEAGPSRGRTRVRHKRFFDPNTSLPLLETAVPQQQQTTGGNCDVAHSGHSPSPPPLPPVNLADLRQRREGITSPQQPSQQLLTAAASGGHSEQQSPSSDTDDVFLPEAKKPVGIYQCAETYEPRFEGEMPLQRDEVVVVMEVGRGEWVWAVGTENKEGLVPKSLLHKYRPDIPEGREEFEEEQDIGEDIEDSREEETMVLTNVSSSAAAVTDTSTSATQTELIINGVVWEISSSIPTQQRLALTQPPDTATVSIQTEFTSPNWFQNNTPTPTPKNTLPRSTSISTAPHVHQEHTTHPNPPTRTATAATFAQPKLLCAPRSSQTATSSRQQPPTPQNPEPASSTSLNPRTSTEGALPVSHTSQRPAISVQGPNNGARKDVLLDSSTATPATECVASNSTPQVTRQHPGAGNATRGGPPCSGRGHLPVVSSNTGTIQRHRQALRQHVRVVTSVPFEPDNEATTNCTQSLASSRRRVQPTPIVTALRDYAPPQQAKNALALRKGDVMYAQPHVPYPYGWIWVYHTVLKKYGYVPKEYIAYMYLVQKDQGTILEDVV